MHGKGTQYEYLSFINQLLFFPVRDIDIECQPFIDVFQFIKIVDISRGRNKCNIHWPAFRRISNFYHLKFIGNFIQLLKITDQFFISKQIPVRPWLKSKIIGRFLLSHQYRDHYQGQCNYGHQGLAAISRLRKFHYSFFCI